MVLRRGACRMLSCWPAVVCLPVCLSPGSELLGQRWDPVYPCHFRQFTQYLARSRWSVKACWKLHDNLIFVWETWRLPQRKQACFWQENYLLGELRIFMSTLSVLGLGTHLVLITVHIISILQMNNYIKSICQASCFLLIKYIDYMCQVLCYSVHSHLYVILTVTLGGLYCHLISEVSELSPCLRSPR